MISLKTLLLSYCYFDYVVPERQLLEINLSEDALPWERIGFDIVTQNSTQSTLVGRTKLCFKKIDTIEAVSYTHLRCRRTRLW